jgi:hypothetical protein
LKATIAVPGRPSRIVATMLASSPPNFQSSSIRLVAEPPCSVGPWHDAQNCAYVAAPGLPPPRPWRCPAAEPPA